MRVLQVEDNATTAKSVELMLKSQGHVCTTAHSGEEALRLVQDGEFDLILLDIMLPDIDGYEVLKRIQGWGIETPVMIQSGLAGEDGGGAFGMVDCLPKPYGAKELKDRIDAISQRTAKAAAAAEAQGGEAGPAADAPAAEAKSDGDRRGKHRTRTIKSGLIVYNNSNCDMDCLVLSLSADGAALQPLDTLNIPENFTLKIKDGSVHKCQVCWRHNNKLGVRFLNA